MKTKILMGLVLCLLAINASSNLGTYVTGDNVTYSAVCHTDEGRIDSGCSSGNGTVFAPNGSIMGIRTMTELSDSIAPGLWFGSYVINNSDPSPGTWSVYIRITNSNSTEGGTVKQFQVMESDSGLGNISDKLDTIDGNVDSVLDDTQTTGVAIAGSQTVDTCSACTDVTNAVNINSNADITAILRGHETVSGSVNATPVAVDTQLNSSHPGNWSTDLTAVEIDAQFNASHPGNVSAISDLTAIEIDTQLNLSHKGNWSDKADVSSLPTLTELTGFISGLNITMLNNFTQTLDQLTTIAGYIDIEITSLITGQVTISTDINTTSGNISDILNVTGWPGNYDNSIRDMLGYNISDDNVETDLDAAGGTTPVAVWQYGNRNLTTPITESGLNMTGIIVDISSLATSTKIDELNVSIQTSTGNFIDGLNITMLGNFTQTLNELATLIGYVDTEISALLRGDITISTDLNATPVAVDTQLNLSHPGNWSTLNDLTAVDVDTQLNVSHPGNWSALNDLTVADVDTQLNSSHPGNWSAKNELTVEEIDSQLNDSHDEGSWKTAPPTTMVVDFDSSLSGLLNVTILNGEVAHIKGDIEPENSESMKDNYYLKSVFDIGNLPVNMTHAWLTYWAKKTGSPTGDLNISINGNLINTTDVSTYSTSITKYMIPFGVGNITSGYIEILFNGSASWATVNYPFIGSDETIGVNSYASDDAGTTWVHVTNELAVGLIIEYNQEPIVEQLNEEVHNIMEEPMDAGCIGENVVARLSGKNFKGESLIADSLDIVCSIEVFNVSSATKSELSSATFSYGNETTTDGDTREAYVVWNNTDIAVYGKTYEFECDLNWTHGTTVYNYVMDQSFIFSRECEIETNISVVQADLDDPDQYKSNATIEKQDEILVGMLTNTSQIVTEIKATNTSVQNNLSLILSDIIDVQTDLDNTEQYKSNTTVEKQNEILAGLIANASLIVDEIKAANLSVQNNLSLILSGIIDTQTDLDDTEQYKSNATVEKQDEIIGAHDGNMSLLAIQSSMVRVSGDVNNTRNNQTGIVAALITAQADLDDTEQYKSNATVEKQDEILAGMLTNTSRIVTEIKATNKSIQDNLSIILTDIITIQADLDNTEQYKSNATVEKQDEILSGIIANNTIILTKIDEVNISLQAFVGNYIDGLNTTILGNFSYIRSDILTVTGYVDDVSSGGIKTVYDIVASVTYGLSVIKTLIDSIISGQVTISTDLNDTEQYKSNATVEKQDIILAGIIANTTAIRSAINTSTAAVEGAVSSNTTVIESAISGNTSQMMTAIQSINDTISIFNIWNYTLGTNRSANASITYLYDIGVEGGGSVW